MYLFGFFAFALIDRHVDKILVYQHDDGFWDERTPKNFRGYISIDDGSVSEQCPRCSKYNTSWFKSGKSIKHLCNDCELVFRQGESLSPEPCPRCHGETKKDGVINKRSLQAMRCLNPKCNHRFQMGSAVRRVVCPYCNGTDTKKAGWQNGKQQYYCKTSRRYFREV